MCWACTVLIERADRYNCSSFKQCSDMPCTENQILVLAAISPFVYQSHPRHSWSCLNINCFYCCQPHAQPPIRRTSVSLFVWVITFDLYRMRDLTSSCATAGLALRIFLTTQAQQLRESRDTIGGLGGCGGEKISLYPPDSNPGRSSPYGVAMPKTLWRLRTVLKLIRNCAVSRLFSLGGVVYPQDKT